MDDSVLTTGVPSPGELAACPGVPSEERMRKGRVSVIECFQEIPCNPCESACPYGAITVGLPITSLPVLDGVKCRGCGKCIPCCPGLAIFIVDKSRADGLAVVEFPYEFLPLPRKGDFVTAVNRAGAELCKAKIISVRRDASYDGTAVVGMLLPAEYADDARGMKRLPRPDMRDNPNNPGCETPGAPSVHAGRVSLGRGGSCAPAPGKRADDGDLLICRCREITKREILGAIAEGATTVDGVKRRSGACMGLCQGKTCERLVARIIADETGQDIADILPQKVRMPVRPVQISIMRPPDGGADSPLVAGSDGPHISPAGGPLDGEGVR